MEKNKYFSYTNILFFSLLFTESFYFTLRISASMIDGRGESYIALNRFQVQEIITSLLALFIFSLIFIFLLKFIFNSKFFLSRILNLLFLSYILGLMIKIFFDAADYSWHHVGFRNIYPLINLSILKKYFSFIWFVTPFLFSTIILIYFKKTNSIIRLINSFSIVFLFLMVWQIFSLNSIHSKLIGDNLNENKFNQNKIKTSPKKVLWILFDGFDPGIAFSKKENPYKLNNFEHLKKKSIYHSQMYSPARDTFFAIPGMLMGKNVNGFSYENYRFSVLSENGKQIKFNNKNTIFGKLDKKGLTSAITGMGFHSYCKMINVLKCQVFNEPIKWYDGISHIFQLKLVKAHFFKIGAHRDINPQIISKMFDYLESEEPTNFLFVHNRVPHLCHKCADGFAGMAQKVLKKDHKILTLHKERREGYLLNLLFVDYLIGEIFKRFDNKDKYPDNDTLVIFTSDHWAKEDIDFQTRLSEKKDRKPYPSLFFAKILGDDKSFNLNNPSSSIHIPELIELFFDEKIINHNDIDLFLQKKNGYKVYYPKNISFENEDDF